jgi:sirohydrochlorin ferrochelatase
MKFKLLTLGFFCLILVQNSYSFQSTPKNTKVGILVLAHGSQNPGWNATIKDVTKSLDQKYPLEIAFGMANPYSMQPAIKKLEEQGVNTIVAVQLFVSSFSPIIRQNEYLLGLRDTLSDTPIPPMPHEMNQPEMANMDHSKPFELKPLELNSKVVLTKPLDDHELVAEILFERIKAVSKKPEIETIMLVAHGPVMDADNDHWIAALENLGTKIEALQASTGGSKFHNIVSLTVRDDANEEVYEAAKQDFRTAVKVANKNGDALVIPVLLSKGGVESRYLTRLEGLDYIWGGEAILPHPNVAKYLEIEVERALQQIPVVKH